MNSPHLDLFHPSIGHFLILTPREAAMVDSTGQTSADQVRLAADRGELPVYRTPRGNRLYLRQDIERWLTARRAARPSP